MADVGRNAPCPCGSGRKYKHCCGSAAAPPGARIPTAVIAGRAWEADVFPLPIAFDDDPRARPTSLLVTANELVLAQETSTAPLGEPTEIAAKLAKAIEGARRATGVTPPEVHVRWEDIAQELRARLPADIPVTLRPFLEDLIVPARALLTHVADFPYWPPVSNPDSWLAWGLPRPMIAELFEAAAAFHRARPWRWLKDVPPVIVQLPGDRTWTVATMGSGGQEFGLTMYADLDDYLTTINADDPRESAASLAGRTIALGFGRLGDFPRRIQREVASSGWRVAAPDAYPLLLPMNTPAGGLSRADARDLVAVLRAVPAFAAEHRHLLERDRVSDTIAWTHEPTGAAMLYQADPGFSWIDDEDDDVDALLDAEDLLDAESGVWRVPPVPRRRTGRRSRRGTGRRPESSEPRSPVRGSAEAVPAVLDDAFVCIDGYASRDPFATPMLVDAAKHLLHEYARLRPDELSRVLKPEAWAGGALHAAFQVMSSAERTGSMLAAAFAVSSSAVTVRSRKLREAVDWPLAPPTAEEDAPLWLWRDAAPEDVTAHSGHDAVADAGEDTRATPRPEARRHVTNAAGDAVAERDTGDAVAARAGGADILPFAPRSATPDATSPAVASRHGAGREARDTVKRAAGGRPRGENGPGFTPLQGQYLAFIHSYTKINRRPPAEADLQAYFRVTPPSVHNMILTLERKGLIARVPGQARSIRVLLEREALPDLE